MSGTKMEKAMLVKAIQPVTGCYPCTVREHDFQQTVYVDDENGGEPIKKTRFYKKYVLLVDFVQIASKRDVEDDAERVARGEPSRLHVDENGTPRIFVPGNTAILPDDVAQGLIARGLVEEVTGDDPEPQPELKTAPAHDPRTRGAQRKVAA